MFRDVLVRRYGFKEQNVVTLTDRNGTRGQVINAFRRFLFQAGPNGTVVFYFSGKGTLLDGRSGIDGSDDPAHDGRNEALYVWANAAEEKGGLILDDELGVLANELRAGRVLIVLDACYSGTATGGGAGAPKLAPYDTIEKVIGQPAAFLGTRKGQQADLPAGHILLSASRDNEVAWTSNDWPTRGGLASVFTYSLVDAMQRAGAGTTVEELMVTVGDSTNAYSRARHGKTQRPQAEGGRIGESLAEYLGE
jgi:hypothetical protein